VKRRFASLALALFVVAAAAPVRAAEVPAIEDLPGPVVQLLEDYSRGWLTKDAVLLTSTLTGTLQKREARALINAAEVHFTSFRVRATTQFSGNLATDRIWARHKDARDVKTYQVVEESRLGRETSTYAEDGAFTFVRGRTNDYDGWRIAAKDDLNVLGFFSPYHLWDEAPVSVLTGKRFTLLTHVNVVDSLRPVLGVAERAYDNDAKFWPEPLRDHIVMIVPSTTAELGRVMHETVDLEKFVAFVGNGTNREHGWAPTGPRMFVHLSHLKNYGTDGQFSVLAHELIHAVTRKVAGPKIPAWIEEGLANFGGGNGGRARVTTGGPAPDVFPTDERFVTGAVRDIQAVYDEAQIAIQVLDEKFGRAGLVKFYEELGSRRVVPGTEEYHIRASIKQSLGWSYDEWVAAWRKALAAG
jgi:hypothetical protein